MSPTSPEPPARRDFDFAAQSDVDRFIDTLSRFERGEIDEAEWRAFRLVHGTYGQRQPGEASMLRAKLPQGIVDARKLRALAAVADEHSRGFCHVTTRQNVQFHFVPLSRMGEVMTQLVEAGITTKEACGNSVRNIVASPSAGLAADEVFDVSPHAEALTRFLLRHPLAATLPRKFKIAFSAGGADHGFAAINDIGFHARRASDGHGEAFTVTVAGGTATKCVSGRVLFEELAPPRIFAVAEALLRVFDAEGDRVHRKKNRMKFLVGKLGWEAFEARFASALADVERAEFAAPALAPRAVSHASPRPWSLPSESALAAIAATSELSGPGLRPRALPLLGSRSDFEVWRRSNVRSQHHAGYSLVTVTLPLGDVTSGQLRVLAHLVDACADGEARLTPDQNVLLRWVPDERLREVYGALRATGLATPDAGTLADPTSCPGAESCKLAVTQSRGLARLISDRFEDERALLDRAGPLSVRISGCPNGCGLHHVAAVGFQGGLRKVGERPVPQYFVYAGGRVEGALARFGTVVAKVPARRAPEALRGLVELAEQHRAEGEPLDAVLARLDAKLLKSALADLEPLAAADATDEDFVDLGETDAFRPETSEGECAA